MATTSFCYSAKAELAMGVHNFSAALASLAGAGVNTQFTVTGLASTAAITVGMAASGTNVAAGAIVASIDSATAVTVSKPHTGTVTSGTIGFTGDAFKMLLIKTAPTRTFDGSQTNVGTPGTAAPSATNVGTDETSGTAYTTGGFALTNISPAVGTTAGFWSFTTNPSWAAASFSATAAIIFSTSIKQGHANGITANASGSALGRTISVHDFGGTQTVSSGTFTVILPTNAQGTAILQIS